MWMALGIISFLGFFVCLIWLIVYAVKRYYLKAPLISLLVCLVLFFAAAMLDSSSDEKELKGEPKEEASESLENPDEKEPEEAPEPETPEPKDGQIDKNAVIELDKNVLTICGQAENYYSEFLQLPKLENLSELDYYNAAKNMRRNISDCRMVLLDVSAKDFDGFEDYKESAMVYMYVMMEVADKLMKYLDNPKPGTLSDFQEATESISAYRLQCAAQRATFYGKMGFETSEIPSATELQGS